MALIELKRSLLLPAILIAASLTLVGCAGGTSNDSSNNQSNSSSSDDEDEDSDEDEAEEVDSSAEGHCPAGFELAAAVNLAGQDTTITILTAGEFSVPAVGADILSTGCLFESTSDVDGTSYTAQSGYLPGDAAVLAQIGANLEAAGFTSLSGTDGFYTLDKTSIVIYDSADLPGGAESAGPLNLGFGDSFLVITVIQA